MKHFIAYGNADQQSFRTPGVRDALDYVTVPGTIAAYYPSATAGFILSLGLPYIVEPRTPLFQSEIDHPRASHYSLAEWLGEPVRAHLENADPEEVVSFPSDFYTQGVLDEMVGTLVGRQRSYGSQAEDDEEAFNRYSALLAEALPSDAGLPQLGDAPPPSFILAPYFASRSTADPWWDVNRAIWETCLALDEANEVSPVVAVTSPGFLGDAIIAVPEGLSATTFYWIAGFDERRAPSAELEVVWSTVAEHGDNLRLVNLYGGFFSICMAKAGLWGFNNGLGYSEARNWPELGATGAAPPRYYLPSLHQFQPLAAAQVLIDMDESLACSCAVCEPRQGRVAGLQYQQLKRHFALVRQQEIRLVEETDSQTLALTLESTASHFDLNVRPELPPGLWIQLDYLYRWAHVIRSHS